MDEKNLQRYIYIGVLIAGIVANYAVMQDRLSSMQSQVQELNDDLDALQAQVTEILIDQRLVQLRLDNLEKE